MGGAQCVGALRQLCSSEAINTRRARDQDMMHLLRCWYIFSVHFKFTLPSAHVQGVKSSTADTISHNRWSLLLQKLSSQIHQEPALLRELVLDKRSDWASQHWREQFSAILKGACQLHASLLYIS